MPKGKKGEVKRHTWSEEDNKNALSDVSTGSSVRSAAKRYGMSEGIIRHRIIMEKEGRNLIGRGKTTTLDKETEASLARCIGTMCRLGFSPTREQIKELVYEYVSQNKIKSPFKDGRPGKDWLRLYMKRNNLSMKKANMISSARKSATSNPFIIFDFFDIIEKIIKDQNLQGENIWNCDESGFPTDPTRAKVVGVKGETSYKVTSGAGRENITTLAACNAAGRAIGPLIVFKGANFQSIWRGRKPLPNTFYGISNNGWMTTEVFYEKNGLYIFASL